MNCAWGAATMTFSDADEPCLAATISWMLMLQAAVSNPKSRSANVPVSRLMSIRTRPFRSGYAVSIT